jgi:hypothetical protein
LGTLDDLFEDAFAVRDEASLRWAIQEIPFIPEMRSDEKFWSYLAFRAIVLRDESLIQESISDWPHLPSSEHVPALHQILLAILQRNPSSVSQALNTAIEQDREELGYAFGIFSLTAHAGYWAAYWLDPALVVEFDVTQAIPWDAEYHALCVSSSDALASFDFSPAPAELCDVLSTQKIPQWVKDAAASHKPNIPLFSILLTDVGERPDDVYDLIEEMLHWTREEFDYRTSKLPLTLFRKSTDSSVTRLHDMFAEVGATVKPGPNLG